MDADHVYLWISFLNKSVGNTQLNESGKLPQHFTILIHCILPTHPYYVWDENIRNSGFQQRKKKIDSCVCRQLQSQYSALHWSITILAFDVMLCYERHVLDDIQMVQFVYDEQRLWCILKKENNVNVWWQSAQSSCPKRFSCLKEACNQSCQKLKYILVSSHKISRQIYKGCKSTMNFSYIPNTNEH